MNKEKIKKNIQKRIRRRRKISCIQAERLSTA